MTEEEVEKFIKEKSLYYSPCGYGDFYASDPVVKHTKRRTLITYRSGYDI